jgi:hypothetical protein
MIAAARRLAQHEVLLLFQSRRGRVGPPEAEMHFKVFIDEAGTDGRSPYMMLGGYVAAEARWSVVDFK